MSIRGSSFQESIRSFFSSLFLVIHSQILQGTGYDWCHRAVWGQSLEVYWSQSTCWRKACLNSTQSIHFFDQVEAIVWLVWYHRTIVQHPRQSEGTGLDQIRETRSGHRSALITVVSALEVSWASICFTWPSVRLECIAFLAGFSFNLPNMSDFFA